MSRTLFALLLLAILAAPEAHAQAPGSTQVPTLIEPFDFSPTGAWRRRAAQVRDLRRQLLRNGDFRSLNAVPGGPRFAPSLVAPGGASTAVTGAFKIPVILLAYKNVDVPFPVADYQCLLFSPNPLGCSQPGPHPYSVKTFYEELSHHRISMDGVVFPNIRMDSVAGFYTDGCKGITVTNQTNCPNHPEGNRMAIMLRAALDSISNGPNAATVWSQFDNDGPDGIPNSGDDDGVVDFVTFLQPQVGGECGGTPNQTGGVWSHRFVISGWGGSAYVTKTPRVGGAGGFIRVNDYTIQSQLGGTTSCIPTEIMSVGTVSHETGHAFGLPDLYDTRGATQGIGGWGLMGSGNYARPYSPSSYDAWSLNTLGWATIDSLGTSRTIVAGPRLLSDTVFYAKTHNLDEYVLLENRAAVLSDTAQMNPALSGECPQPSGSAFAGACMKSPGLLVWLINEAMVDGGIGPNTVNTGPLQGVALIQADGLNQLRTPGTRNRGDRGDSYPGSTGNTKFSLLTNPAARDNFGTYLGFILDKIPPVGGGPMQFRFTRREPTVVKAQNGAQVHVDGQIWDVYEEVVPVGDFIDISVDTPQLLDGGKTRATFLTWSNGVTTPAQTLTSTGTKPDTVTASFRLEHRLLLLAVSGGTVTSSVTGDLSAGVFLTPGVPVTLTATPAQGFIFAGWRGDTVAVNPTLQLSMQRGYDLEARFVASVPVVMADAVSEVLGTPKLTDQQRTYLDELGNRNGILDVGDILALLRRSGQAAPPALLRAALPPPPRPKDPQ